MARERPRGGSSVQSLAEKPVSHIADEAVKRRSVDKAGLARGAEAGAVASQMLFLFDERCFDALRIGKPPRVPYSHDLNLIQFAHEALKHGCQIHFARNLGLATKGSILTVQALFPKLKAKPAQIDTAKMDFVFSSGIEQLNVRPLFPEARIVAFAPAMHMIESPFAQSPREIISWINAARFHIDYFITQNDRMKDILRVLVQWLARWDPSDRILVAPLGYAIEDNVQLFERRTIREKYGVDADDILIANAGGAWPWTDCDTMIAAAVEHFKRVPNSRLRLYFPGLTQKDNKEFNPVIRKIQALEKKNPDIFGKNLKDGKSITIENDWVKGGKQLPEVLAASDIGLSVNRATLESWQSHRVRMIDYAAKGLAIIATTESELFDRLEPGIFQVSAEDMQSYLDLYAKLEAGADKILPEKRAALQKAATALRTDRSYPPALKQLLQGYSRSVLGIEPSVLDEEIVRVVQSMKKKVSDRLDELWSL